MLWDLLGFAIANQFGNDEAKDAAAKSFIQGATVMVGVLLVITGIAFVLSGSKTAQLAGSVAEIVATKGAALAK